MFYWLCCSRGSLFLLTYLLFLINIVVGLIAAIWRMVITALYNIIHLGRMDISLLNRAAESYDPGTSTYSSGNSIGTFLLLKGLPLVHLLQNGYCRGVLVTSSVTWMNVRNKGFEEPCWLDMCLRETATLLWSSASQLCLSWPLGWPVQADYFVQMVAIHKYVKKM